MVGIGLTGGFMAKSLLITKIEKAIKALDEVDKEVTWKEIEPTWWQHLCTARKSLYKQLEYLKKEAAEDLILYKMCDFL
jgi:hypothetical protein